ncbi:hypothetical protein J6590_076168 [Homalodisca vitripennis]|nr:hypothetical protein J6590_076168 [Homalodisca vitripennis]
MRLSVVQPGHRGIAGNEEADLLHKKEIRPHLFVLSHSAELAVPRLFQYQFGLNLYKEPIPRLPSPCVAWAEMT